MFCFSKILFIYSRERERQTHRQKEKQAPCREPNVRLDPSTLGSCPEPKADAQPLSHPSILVLFLDLLERERERENGGGEGRKRGRKRISRRLHAHWLKS